MPTLDYPIRTARLSLRPYEPADFAAALDYWSSAEVTRYIPLGPFTRETFVERFDRLMTRTSMTAEGEGLVLAVVPHGVDHVIGDMTLHWSSAEHRTGELGFIFHPAHHGRGYATEASIPLLRFAFEQLDFHRMMARLDARNGASAAVLRKLGLRQEAHLIENEWMKGEWTSELVFAMLQSEWRTHQASGPTSIHPGASD